MAKSMKRSSAKRTKPIAAGTSAKQRADLIEMCVGIYAHSECDHEITLAGNGINSSEASHVAKAILQILQVDRKSLDKRIAARVNELHTEEDRED